MEKRGQKPKFTTFACPNEFCRDHLVIGKGNVVGKGTYELDGKRIRRFLCRSCGRAFCDRTDTFYYGLHTNEKIIELALKMFIKSMRMKLCRSFRGSTSYCK